MKQKIEFRKKDHGLFLLFWKKLETKLDTTRNVVMENTDDSIILSYELPGSSSRIIKKLIRLWLADSIVLYYKEKYLKDHLLIPGKPDYITSGLILKALTVFDKSTDTEMVIGKMSGRTFINVHSFYVFCMGDNRARWQEICDLFSKSMPNLLASDVFMELMRYLLVGSEPAVSEAKVEIKDGMVLVTDCLGRNLVGPISTREPDFVSRVMLELVGLAPSKIIIGFSRAERPDLVSAINNLFESKVVYCT